MTAVVRFSAFLACVMLLGACQHAEGPTAPSSTQPPSQQPSAPQPPVAQPPAPTVPATTYLFDNSLSYAVSSHTTASRYVLYDNGAFGLEYAAFAYVFRGTYWQAGTDIYFDFDADGLWEASGTLKGTRLEVRYDEQMQHSDFDDAAYRRWP